MLPAYACDDVLTPRLAISPLTHVSAAARSLSATIATPPTSRPWPNIVSPVIPAAVGMPTSETSPSIHGLKAEVYWRPGETAAVSLLSTLSRALSNWERSWKPGKWLMKSASFACWSPGRSVLTSRNAMAFFGATLAVSDFAPAAPERTKTPPAVTRVTHRTTAPAMPQRSRLERGDTTTGCTPGAHSSPTGTIVPWGTGSVWGRPKPALGSWYGSIVFLPYARIPGNRRPSRPPENCFMTF